MKALLNLPLADVKLKDNLIWDRLRKKYIPLTPEEWVRQHFIAYLIDHLAYPEGKMVSEHIVTYNGMNKRCDIVGFGEDFLPLFIVECKAPAIAISEDTFYQAARYFSSLKPTFLMLTNGMHHYCAKIDSLAGALVYLQEIPAFSALKG